MKLFTLFLAFAGSASFASGQTPANCTSNLDEIFDAQFDDSGTLIPPDFPQVWTLCPETEYKIGFLTDDGVVGGFLPLSLRPNMTIKCGEDGKSSNNCNMTTGTVAMIAYTGLFDQNEFYFENTVLSGVTFTESIREQYFVIGDMGGQLEIIDCRFYGSAVYDTVTLYALFVDKKAPQRRQLELNGDETTLERAGKSIAHYMDEYESRKAEVREMVRTYASTEEKDRRLQSSGQDLFEDDNYIIFPLSITFTDCLFENNTIVTPLPSQSDAEIFMVALMTGFEYVTFKNTMFRNNDWVGNPAATSPITAIIGAGLGGRIAFDTCCFIDNKVVGPAYAMTTNGAYPQMPMEIMSSNTYATKNEGQLCTFAWYNDTIFSETEYSLGNATCVDTGLVDTCMIVESAPTTMAPIGAILPTTVASIAPTATVAPIAPTATVAPATVAPVVNPVTTAPVGGEVSTAPVTTAPVDGTMTAAPVTTAPVTTAPTGVMTTAPVATVAPTSLAPSTAVPAVTESPVTVAPSEVNILPTRNTPPPTLLPTSKSPSISGTPAVLPLWTAFVAMVMGAVVA